MTPGGYYNTGWYLSVTHLKLKTHQDYFFHNINVSYWIILKFCTEHAAVLHAKFQEDSITEK